MAQHDASVIARAMATAALVLVLGCNREAGRSAAQAVEPAEAEKPSAVASATLPPTALPDLVESLAQDLRATRHPSDGGGSVRPDPRVAWDDPAIAGRPGRWAFLYEAGPLGIAEGGALFFQAPPFWGWSTPQVQSETYEGFTRVTTDAAGVELRPQTIDTGLLRIAVSARPLAAGERVRIVYGAGARKALADRYAERDSRFWFAVDGDGDGVRALLSEAPSIDVLAGPPARLQLVLPSTARPGEEVTLTAAVLDAAANAGTRFEGELRFSDIPSGLDLPETVRFTAADNGRRAVRARAPAAGVYRLRGSLRIGDAQELRAESNPMEVSARAPRILWADLHGHSSVSDGTGRPEDYFRYARDVAALDVAALTDHDHWGMRFLDRSEDLWRDIRSAVARSNQPGRFVALLGYEWTSWIYGHRHVLYFSDDGRVLSTLDPATDTPQELWRALAGRPAITVAHHSAGGPIATDWSVAPDPRLEPVTEVVSVHGVSEAADAPARIYSPVAGNSVRDALDRGYRLGFVGSGDTHDGHPGNGHLGAPTGGLAAILSSQATREGVLAALRARRSYATSGARIILRMALAASGMGSVVEADELPEEAVLYARVIGTAPLERLDIVRSGEVVERMPLGPALEATVERTLPKLRGGEYVYVRVLQADGALAWASPVFVE